MFTKLPSDSKSEQTKSHPESSTELRASKEAPVAVEPSKTEEDTIIELFVFNEYRQTNLNFIKSLGEITIYSEEKLPKSMSADDATKLASFCEMLALVCNKFDIGQMWASFNVSKKEFTAEFSNRSYVGGSFACQPALDFFKEALNCDNKEFFMRQIVTLSVEKCNAAIQCLKLKEDITPEMIAERSRNTVIAMC